jgi:hypothetical protein
MQRVCNYEDELERLDGRQYHNNDEENSRYLIDNTIEFLGMPISVKAEFIYPVRE